MKETKNDKPIGTRSRVMKEKKRKNKNKTKAIHTFGF
jgi:hypothetical protein